MIFEAFTFLFNIPTYISWAYNNAESLAAQTVASAENAAAAVPVGSYAFWRGPL